MSSSPATRYGIGRRIPDVLLILAASLSVSLALASVWSTAQPPATDLPSWMALANLMTAPHSEIVQAHYAFQLVPNLASTLPIALLSLVFAPETSARITCSLAIVGLPCATWLLSRTTWSTPRPGWVVGVLLAQNVALLNGQIGFALALPVALGAASVLYAIWPRHSLRLVLAGSLLGVGILALHALAWWIYALFIVACTLHWPRPRRGLWATLLLGPSLMLFLAWSLLRNGPPEAPEWWVPHGRLQAVTGLLPVAVFEPLYHPVPVSLVSVLAIAAIAILLGDRLGSHGWTALVPAPGRTRATWTAGLLCIGCGLLAPDRLGSVYGVPARLVLAGVLILAVASAVPRRSRVRHWVVVGVALFATTSNLIGAMEAQSELRTCKIASNDLPSDSAVFQLPHPSPNRDPLRRLAVPVHPFRHTHAFRVLDELGPSCALFRTGPIRPANCYPGHYPVARGTTPREIAESIRQGAAVLETPTVFLTGAPEIVSAVGRLLGTDRGSPYCRVVAIR